MVQRLIGDHPAAAGSLTQALELFRDLGDRRGQAWTLDDLGVLQRRTRDYPAAAASLTRALQLSCDLGDRQGQAWALNQLGVVQQLTGDCPAAAASLTRALELFGDLGDRHGQAVASINLGELLALSSAHRQARGYYTQALGIARDIKAPVHESTGTRRNRTKPHPGRKPWPGHRTSTASPRDLPAHRSPRGPARRNDPPQLAMMTAKTGGTSPHR